MCVKVTKIQFKRMHSRRFKKVHEGSRRFKNIQEYLKGIKNIKEESKRFKKVQFLATKTDSQSENDT